VRGSGADDGRKSGTRCTRAPDAAAAATATSCERASVTITRASAPRTMRASSGAVNRGPNGAIGRFAPAPPSRSASASELVLNKAGTNRPGSGSRAVNHSAACMDLPISLRPVTASDSSSIARRSLLAWTVHTSSSQAIHAP